MVHLRLMRNKNIQICKEGKLIGPSQAGGDLFDIAVGTATDLFVHHGLPWMGKKQLRWEDIMVRRL